MSKSENGAERRVEPRPEDAWAWKRIEGYLRDYLDGGPDYEIVCRGVGMQIGVAPDIIKEMWRDARKYKHEEELKAVGAAPAGGEAA
jgi:hypothetical protein